jgi:hypothetical protein
MSERLGAEIMARVVSVCDREADMYEYLRYKQGEGQRFVVRAAHIDRQVQQPEACMMVEAVRAAPVLGELGTVIEQRGGKHARRKRTVKLALRACSRSIPRYCAVGPQHIDASRIQSHGAGQRDPGCGVAAQHTDQHARGARQACAPTPLCASRDRRGVSQPARVSLANSSSMRNRRKKKAGSCNKAWHTLGVFGLGKLETPLTGSVNQDP